jgi:hypothetical protein
MNTSSSADGISDDGVIVGTGVHDGEIHAYAMVPGSAYHSHAQPYTKCNGYSDRDTKCNGYAHGHTYSNRCAKDYSYTKAPANSAAATVLISRSD